MLSTWLTDDPSLRWQSGPISTTSSRPPRARKTLWSHPLAPRRRLPCGMKEPSTYLTRHKKGSANMTLRIPTGGMVFSIGYEGRTLQELLKLLEVYRVDLVVDVRENPISRKPGFNRRQLSAALQSAGI